MDYIKVFEGIREDINDHPYLTLVEYKINKGFNGKKFSKVKKELYEILGYFKNINMESIFEFYKQCNGVKIRWKIKSDIDEATYEKLPDFFPGFKLPFKKELAIGNINILPLEEVFIYEQNYFDKSDSGDHFTQFGNHTYEGNSFGKMLFIFDLYSDVDCMAFVSDEDNSEPKVIYLSDNYVVWDNSRVSFFKSYINFLVVTRGFVESREEFFDYYRGDKIEPLLYKSAPYGTDVEPSLFK